MNTAPVTDRPTHATEPLIRSILAAHPEGLTDDAIWKLTGLSHKHHGSVVRRRKDTGAVKVGKSKSLLKRSCTIWALPS